MRNHLIATIFFFSAFFISVSAQKNESGFELGSYNGYYTLDEVYTELDSMRLNFPTLITERDSIGTSWEGRAIYAVKISDNADTDEEEPEVFLNSLIHGVEPMSMMVLM